MKRSITITVDSPTDCTEEQFREWVEYCLGYSGSIKIENPLSEYDLETTSISI